MGYDWKTLHQPGRLEAIANQIHAGTVDDLLAATGYGGLTVNGILLKLIDIDKKEKEKEQPPVSNLQETLDSLRLTNRKHKNPSGVLVKGEPGLLVHMARCCTPVPGDPIVGYITRGRGVSVHRMDCANMMNINDPERLIEVSWEYGIDETFLVEVEIKGNDRPGLMADILGVISEMKLSIGSVRADLPQNKEAHIWMGIQIRDVSQLEFVMTKMRRVRDVYSVRRLQAADRG